MNSRAKGVRGELQVAHLFKSFGYQAERGCQHDGMTGHADVVGVPHLWLEVKRNEQLNVHEAMNQADRDNIGYFQRTGEDLLSVVIHRKNNQTWKCTMRLIDFLAMCGCTPFSTDVPVDGLVTMEWEEWIKVYMAYENERSAG